MHELSVHVLGFWAEYTTPCMCSQGVTCVTATTLELVSMLAQGHTVVGELDAVCVETF